MGKEPEDFSLQSPASLPTSPQTKPQRQESWPGVRPVSLTVTEVGGQGQAWSWRPREDSHSKGKIWAQHTSYPVTYYCEAGYKTLPVVSGMLPEKGYGFLRPL